MVEHRFTTGETLFREGDPTNTVVTLMLVTKQPAPVGPLWKFV